MAGGTMNPIERIITIAALYAAAYYLHRLSMRIAEEAERPEQRTP